MKADMKMEYKFVGNEKRIMVWSKLRERGNKVKYGVFYGIVRGFTPKNDQVYVDFSNGAEDPTLMYYVRSAELIKVVEKV